MCYARNGFDNVFCSVPGIPAVNRAVQGYFVPIHLYFNIRRVYLVVVAQAFAYIFTNAF